MSTIGRLGVMLCVLGGAAWWAGSSKSPSTKDPSPAAPAMPPAHARRVLPPAERPYHGLALQIHHSADCVARVGKLLGEIADLGADTVLISNPGYQEHAGSDTFEIDPEVTPSPDEWKQILDIAHHHGLRVILMPIVLLSQPRGNEWRGVIQPPSWDDWFERYREFILHFARLAENNAVEVMTVGSELVSTEKYTDRWRSLIREVRKVYHGKLSYSANWDHYKVVEFWDDLDLVGMTSYYKLSSEPVPTLDSLVAAWQPIKRGILRWQAKVGKPLLFTEVGWCSQEGSSIEPWNYYHKQEATEGGMREQANCYKAFIQTWTRTPEVGGVLWWEWNETPGGPEDYNYTPRGKPAESILRDWWQSNRADTSAATSPAAAASQPATEIR